MKHILLVGFFIIFGAIPNAQETLLSKKSLANLELDTPPIISGCNSKKNKDEIRACLTKKFKRKLDRKIRLSVFTSSDLSIGKHKIMSSFIISKDGEITNINVQHTNSEIIKEIKRALRSFKKIKPGIINGKPVDVPYHFPLYIEIFE